MPRPRSARSAPGGAGPGRGALFRAGGGNGRCEVTAPRPFLPRPPCGGAGSALPARPLLPRGCRRRGAVAPCAERSGAGPRAWGGGSQHGGGAGRRPGAGRGRLPRLGFPAAAPQPSPAGRPPQPGRAGHGRRARLRRARPAPRLGSTEPARPRGKRARGGRGAERRLAAAPARARARGGREAAGSGGGGGSPGAQGERVDEAQGGAGRRGHGHGRDRRPAGPRCGALRAAGRPWGPARLPRLLLARQGRAGPGGREGASGCRRPRGGQRAAAERRPRAAGLAPGSSAGSCRGPAGSPCALWFCAFSGCLFSIVQPLCWVRRWVSLSTRCALRRLGAAAHGGALLALRIQSAYGERG